MDEVAEVFAGLDLVWRFNNRARRAVAAWVWTAPGRVWVAVAGPDAQYLSNALYHAFRAMGRRRVRRWRGRRMWYVAYS
jgi:hypothetical protein